MEKILKKSDLGKWVGKLSAFDCYAPTKENDHWEFNQVTYLDSLPEDYTQVNVPIIATAGPISKKSYRRRRK